MGIGYRKGFGMELDTGGVSELGLGMGRGDVKMCAFGCILGQLKTFSVLSLVGFRTENILKSRRQFALASPS